MKLSKFKIRGFRSYRDEVEIKFEDLTVSSAGMISGSPLSWRLWISSSMKGAVQSSLIRMISMCRLQQKAKLPSL